MRCPYCKSAVETSPATCPRCGISLEKVIRFFGAVPPIIDGISDDAGVFTVHGKRRIKSAAVELAIRFPQTGFTVVTSALPKDTSIGVYAFWIFNEASVTRKVDRGSNNFGILLTLDPTYGRSSLMVGYGLEPYLSETDLDEIIAAAKPFFEMGKYASGVERVIDALRETLTGIVSDLNQLQPLSPEVRAKSSEPKDLAPIEF